MRLASPAPSAASALVGTAAITLAAAFAACQPLDPNSGSGVDGGGGASTADAATEGGVVGAACGAETKTGTQLCAAVSTCPSVVVDTQAMPSCGFRIRGAVVDLVCACQTSLCPMGTFTTCNEASRLLAEQTEGTVCAQLAEGRCTDVAPTTPVGSAEQNGNPACDRNCIRDCGGGAACAAVCNCD